MEEGLRGDGGRVERRWREGTEEMEEGWGERYIYRYCGMPRLLAVRIIPRTILPVG